MVNSIQLYQYYSNRNRDKTKNNKQSLNIYYVTNFSKKKKSKCKINKFICYEIKNNLFYNVKHN
jgi:hypothetical protein